jgi:hypothetical protein
LTLQRGVRKGNFLVQEPTVETTLGVEVLTELRGVAGQVRDLRTMLFGVGDDGVPETPQGRLFRQDNRISAVESKAEANERRIAAVEAKQNSNSVNATAYWSMARVVWAFFAALIIALVGGGFEALIAWLLMRQH